MIAEFSKIAGVPVEVLLGSSRAGDLNVIRQVCWKLMYIPVINSYGMVGKEFGNRDHNTVRLGINHIDNLLETGDKFVAELYNKTKHLKMSGVKRTIEIYPPSPFSHEEHKSFSGYDCPACYGEGGFDIPAGKDRFERKPCTACNGTGKLKAAVSIQWTGDPVAAGKSTGGG